jgi:hypothetical protein
LRVFCGLDPGFRRVVIGSVVEAIDSFADVVIVNVVCCN